MAPKDFRKQLTCHYWSIGNCKFDADTCLYAHHDTGKLAKPPKKAGNASKGEKGDKMRDPSLIDLISLSEEEYLAELEAVTVPNNNSVDSRPSSAPLSKGSESRISPETVIDAVQSGIEYATIKELLDGHNEFSVKEAIRTEKDGYSAIFAAAERGDRAIITLLVQHGANPNATADESGVPVLAHAILKAPSKSTAVKTLLSLGADPLSIPRQLWDDTFTVTEKSAVPSKVGWCSDNLSVSLERRLDLSVKYYIRQASTIAVPTKSYLRTVEDSGMKQLLQVPYKLVGQRLATERVTRYMRSHLIIGAKGPLVMAFMGAPGHGKSELAGFMGQVISLQALVKKSKLNPNIPRDKPARKNSEGRFVVYIDSLEKIDYAWLIGLLDEPEEYVYRDTSTGQITSSADMIFVFATTQGTEEIADFCKVNSEPAREELESLDNLLKKEFQKQFGASLTSRVQGMVPFIQFSEEEATVLAHQYLENARETISKSKALRYADNYKRNVQFVLENETEVCDFLAKRYYDPKFGARSIEQAVIKHVQVPIIDKYVERQLSVGPRDSGSEDGELVFTVKLLTKDYKRIDISVNGL